jgi:glycosyltransferase involved in cell wall biosynthesis
MACGVAVLGTAVGGLIDTVLDGVTGTLVTPHRIRELAAAQRKLLANPGWREGMAAAGVDRAQSRYGWDRIAEDTERVYLRCPGVPDDRRLGETVGARQ